MQVTRRRTTAQAQHRNYILSMQFIDVSALALFPRGAGRAPLQLAHNVVGRPRRSVQATSSWWAPVGATIETKAVWARHP